METLSARRHLTTSAWVIALMILTLLATTLQALNPPAAQASTPRTSTCSSPGSYACLSSYGYGSASTGSWAERYYRFAEHDHHNCTRFAGYFLQTYMGMSDPGHSFGNARNWGLTDAQGGNPNRRSLVEAGATRHSTPRVGDIAWWNSTAGMGSYGHVGVVVKVDGSTVHVASDYYSTNYRSDIRAFSVGAPTAYLRVPDRNGGWPSASGDTTTETTTRTPRNLGRSLDRGETMRRGDYIRSSNGRYQLRLESDGVLRLRDREARNRVIWTNRRSGANRLVVQGDHNLVAYSSSGAVWATGTDGSGRGTVLRMQNDRNLVLRSSLGVGWASRTAVTRVTRDEPSRHGPTQWITRNRGSWTDGYGNDSWSTTSIQSTRSSDTNYFRWRLDANAMGGGSMRVQAFVPKGHGYARGVYKVFELRHDGSRRHLATFRMTQGNYGNQWVTLGRVSVHSRSDVLVHLGDRSPSPYGTELTADAIRLRR